VLFEHRKSHEITGENGEISFYDEFRVAYTQKLRVKSCFFLIYNEKVLPHLAASNLEILWKKHRDGNIFE